MTDEGLPYATAENLSSGSSTNAPVKARGRRRGPLFFALAGGVAAISAVGAAGYARMHASKRGALPIDAAKLPAQTLSLVVRRPGEALDDMATLSDVYVTSGLSPLCGGSDVADLIPLARGKDMAWLKSHGVLDLKTFNKGLQCADVLRQGMTSPSLTEVRFRDGDEVRLVTVTRSRANEMPSGLGYVKHNFSGLTGACSKPPDAKEDCAPGANAGFHDGETWVWGRVDAVEAFARAYTTSHEELSTRVDILQEAIAASGPADVTELFARPDSIDWAAPCTWAAPVGKQKDFVKACFPRGQERLLDGVTSKVRGVAVQRDVIAKAEGIRLTYTLIARDDEAAREIEKDLLDFARDWRAQLANGEADMAKLVRAKSDYVKDAFWASVYEPYVRALRSISVERSGAVVRLNIREKLRPEEAKSLREFSATQTADRNATREVVEAVLTGAPVPEKSMTNFVSAEVAKWINAPRASDAQCTELTGKLTSLVDPHSRNELASSLADYKKACVGDVLPSEYRTCLLAAGDVAAFFKCSIPWSPWTAEAARKLEGQWEASDVEAVGNSDLKSILAKSKLEFAKGRVVTALGPYVSGGDPNVHAKDGGEAELQLPVNDKTSTATVVWVDDDTMKVKDWVPRTIVTYKRAKFTESLLAQATAANARKSPNYEPCLTGCMSHGSDVGECDKRCLGQ